MIKTAFAILLDETGLTIRSAAAFLGVRPKQARMWCIGRPKAPMSVHKRLLAVRDRQDEITDRIYGRWVAMGKPARICITLPADDAGAKADGWPNHTALMKTISNAQALVDTGELVVDYKNPRATETQ